MTATAGSTDVTDATSAGALVYYRLLGAGRPLLLIHGLMMTGEMFEPVLEHFASGHLVIVPDLRGHGRSRTLPPPYTIAQLADDLVDVLDHLGIETADILGYSNGGTVAQQIALDHPEHCARLVLACTYAYNEASAVEWVEGHLGSPLIHVFGMKRFAEFLTSRLRDELGQQTADWAAGMLADQDTELMAQAWNEAMAFDSRARLKDVRCPTLVLAAGQDQALPMHHATMLHQGIPGSRLVVVEDADHTLMWSHTREFLDAVDEFLD